MLQYFYSESDQADLTDVLTFNYSHFFSENRCYVTWI